MNPTADQPPPVRPGARAPQPRELRTVRQTTCCVVGAGPAGAMLALLLARQRVPVVLLEAHSDFDRDFRGDSLHPAIMQVLDELGLADQLLELPHRKLRQATLPASPPVIIDLSRLPGRFPYITLMPRRSSWSSSPPRPPVTPASSWSCAPTSASSSSRTNDLDRSRRFYRDVLGLAACREFGPPGDPRVVFFPGQSLLEVSGHATAPPGGSVMIWIQVRDVHAEHARLAAAGVRIIREPTAEPLGPDRDAGRGPRRHPDRPGRGPCWSPPAP
jgi:predicted enzyme related to lactoylglutathione lyase